MCTLRNQYMKDIISATHKTRYTVREDDMKKQAIIISQAWMAKLQKHPYHLSKWLNLILVEKLGTGIFLMKESAKLHRPQKESEIKKLAKRLWAPSEVVSINKRLRSID